ncbi:MAG: hypothetical protein WCJ98_14370, partial [Mycobacteriaceae bacterium]
MPGSGYLDTPWPAEDGGAARLQVPNGVAGLGLRPGERLLATAVTRVMSTMTVLGAPGEVYLLTHSALRARWGRPTSCRVSRIDPITLAPTAMSPRLPGGPMWPGGMALHANGDLYVVYGRWAHRLDRNCGVKEALKLPVDLPYNSFVVLDNGLIVTKNISDSRNAVLSVLRPDPLGFACDDIECPEPSIARLSAVGNTVYVVGVHSIFRFDWAGQTLVRDEGWRFDYATGTAQTYGWDVVLALGNAWFMDNGKHRYLRSMIGRGVSHTPNRLIRVNLSDCTDVETAEVSGIPGGTITNPPLVDEGRRIVVGYDSANRVLRAWLFDGELRHLWRKDAFGAASHMICLPDSGEIVTNDFGRGGEHVVVLDIETGAEKGRARIGGFTQGVVFPSPGWSR